MGLGRRLKLPPLKLLLITCTLSFLTMANEAYQSILNQPADVLRPWVNESVYAHYGVALSASGLDTLWGAVIAILDVGAVIGSLCIGVAAEKIGRRDTVLLLNPLLTVVSCGLQFLAYYLGAFELILVGRVLIGASLSLGVVVSLYICESCPTYCRGLLGSIPTFFYALWVLIGTVMSMPQMLGRADRWQWLLGFGFVPAVLSVGLRFLVPESPKHLFISRRDPVAATAALEFFHCSGDSGALNAVLDEFEEEERLGRAAGKLGLLEIFRASHLRRAFFVALVTVIAIDFAGIDIAMNYSGTVLKSLGMDESMSAYGTIFTQIPGLIFCILCVFVIEHIGRRSLLFITLTCGVVGNLLFVFAATVPALALPALILVYANHHGGLAPIAGIVTGEVCPQSIRSTTSAVAWTANWAISFVVLLAFPPLKAAIGSATFLIFAVISALILVWEMFYFPETKNRPVSEISSAWLDSKVRLMSETTPLLLSKDVIKELDRDYESK